MAVTANRHFSSKALETKAIKPLPVNCEFRYGDVIPLPFYGVRVTPIDFCSRSGYRLLIADAEDFEKQAWCRIVTLRRLSAGGKLRNGKPSLRRLLGIRGTAGQEREGTDDE